MKKAKKSSAKNKKILITDYYYTTIVAIVTAVAMNVSPIVLEVTESSKGAATCGGSVTRKSFVRQHLKRRKKF